jgi:hypothetical protein
MELSRLAPGNADLMREAAAVEKSLGQWDAGTSGPICSDPVVADVALPFPDSLCHRCRYLRMVGNKRGSQFLGCREPSLPKYPRQPVARCAGFAPGPDVRAPDDAEVAR